MANHTIEGANLTNNKLYEAVEEAEVRHCSTIEISKRCSKTSGTGVSAVAR